MTNILEAKYVDLLSKSAHIVEKLYTSNTLTAYKQDQNTFIQFINKDLLNISTQDVANYIDKLHSKNYSASTIARKIYSMSKLVDILILGGHRLDNPFKKLINLKKNLIPKQIKRVHQALTIEDIKTIKSLRNNKNALLIEFLYSTGARISEALSIKKRDIKPCSTKMSRIDITGKGNKTRTIFVENSFIKRIINTFSYKVHSDFLFHTRNGTPSTRINEYKKITRFIKKVTGKDAHPHQLRHLYATTQIVERKQSIKAVSKYLGHSTTSVTMDMYVDDELSMHKAFLR